MHEENQSYVLTAVECKCMKNGNRIKTAQCPHQRKIKANEGLKIHSTALKSLQQALHLCTSPTKRSGLTL